MPKHFTYMYFLTNLVFISQQKNKSFFRMSQKYIKYLQLVWLEDSEELDGTVPVNWLSADHKYMFWPSRGNVQHQIKNGTKPNELWKKFQIKKMFWNGLFFLKYILYMIASLTQWEVILSKFTFIYIFDIPP